MARFHRGAGGNDKTRTAYTLSIVGFRVLCLDRVATTVVSAAWRSAHSRKPAQAYSGTGTLDFDRTRCASRFAGVPAGPGVGLVSFQVVRRAHGIDEVIELRRGKGALRHCGCCVGGHRYPHKPSVRYLVSARRTSGRGSRLR